jgi:aspartyl/asparaginyl-tRNA synthetase
MERPISISSSEVHGGISMVIWTTGITFIRVSDSQVMVQLMANKGKMSTNVFISLSLLASNSNNIKNRYN